MRNVNFWLQIQRVGAIARDGRLREGQRILEVNGQSLLGATHEEAVKALRSAGDRLNLLICDGYNMSSTGKGTAIHSMCRYDKIFSVWTFNSFNENIAFRVILSFNCTRIQLNVS